MKEIDHKSVFPHLTGARLGLAVMCFAAFLVVGLGAYYVTVGEFVTAELASLYALLSLLGAGAVLLGLWWLAAPYYIGCALAWACGSYVGSLKGDFAPTAGAISAAFVLVVFTLLGLILQWRSLRKRWARHKAEKAAVEAAAQAETEKEQKEAAAVISAAATSAPPAEGSAGDGPSA